MKTKLGVLIAAVILPFYLFADPAKKVNVSFDSATQILKIEAIHPVADVKNHYIDEIKILVDGKEVNVIKPKKQSSLKAEELEIKMEKLSKGNKVEVKTHCNQFGNKSGKLTIK